MQYHGNGLLLRHCYNNKEADWLWAISDMAPFHLKVVLDATSLKFFDNSSPSVSLPDITVLNLFCYVNSTGH